MALLRVLLIILITFAAAASLFYFGSLMGYEEFAGGYAVLVFDESADEKAILSLLKEDDYYFEGEPVCESGQWVFLDEFDSVNAIALDKYFDRIFSFDPRYDSYAETLRSVFVRNGSRYIYAPLKAGSWDTRTLDDYFNSTLNGVEFSREYYGIGRPLNFYFFAYAAASALFLIIFLIYKISSVRKKTRGKPPLILIFIPVFSSLSFFGASGIGAAALMLAFFTLFNEPLNDIFALKKPLSFKEIIKNIILPYKFRWLSIPAFAAAAFVISRYSGLEPSFFLAVFAAGALIFIISKIIFSNVKAKHKRFSPILIIKQRLNPDLSFSLFMLPYTAAAFAVLIFAPLIPSSYDTDNRFETFISEPDYYAHIRNQVYFSTRRMGVSSEAFPDFFFDADGLPSMSFEDHSMDMPAGRDRSININDYPDFPLSDLMEFFQNVNTGETNNAPRYSGYAHIYSMLVLLLFVLPVLFAKRNKKQIIKIKPENLKRSIKRETLRGKLRLLGITQNKKLMYNDKQLSRIQKDA
ncbi:MAG: hypothetical protein FWC21_05185 [Treponema sp.]|nr:hypothetical protein [Treponema sp.]